MALELNAGVRAWLTDDAWETRLCLRSTHHQLLMFRRREPPEAWIELGHGRDSADDRASLTKLGLTRKRWSDGPKAWGKTLNTDTNTREPTGHELAERVSKLWQQACDSEPYELSLLAQRQKPPDNERLVDAMRTAASARDAKSRQRLYAALVNATLLVPIDPETAQLSETDQRPLSLGHDPHGIVSWAAFTSWNALRQWHPEGHPFGLVHGTEFFAHVHDLGRCTVRINPEGVVGGELYPAEVKMMVDTVRRFYGNR